VPGAQCAAAVGRTEHSQAWGGMRKVVSDPVPDPPEACFEEGRRLQLG
jgi:hypothetical protein